VRVGGRGCGGGSGRARRTLAWRPVRPRPGTHGGKAADYLTQISNEQLDKYSGDLVFDDARDPAGQKNADAVPTWKALPAVKAGQVFDWKAAAPYSYAASVSIFDAFAAALEQSKPVA